MGPFYVADTPVVDDLNRHGKPGQPLLLNGRVLSATSGTPPIVGARVEIWQTDGEGDYHPANDGNYADYAEVDIDLRGTVVSGEDGTYTVATLVPGARSYPLVTQFYITGDGVFRQPGGGCKYAQLDETAEGWRYQAPDIYLAKE